MRGHLRAFGPIFLSYDCADTHSNAVDRVAHTSTHRGAFAQANNAKAHPHTNKRTDRLAHILCADYPADTHAH